MVSLRCKLTSLTQSCPSSSKIGEPHQQDFTSQCKTGMPKCLATHLSQLRLARLLRWWCPIKTSCANNSMLSFSTASLWFLTRMSSWFWKLWRSDRPKNEGFSQVKRCFLNASHFCFQDFQYVFPGAGEHRAVLQSFILDGIPHKEGGWHIERPCQIQPTAADGWFASKQTFSPKAMAVIAHDSGMLSPTKIQEWISWLL